jgi:membrane protein
LNSRAALVGVVSTPRRPVPVVRAVLAVAREKHVTASAAGLACDAFGSPVPLGLLASAVVSLLGEFGPVARALERVTGVGAAQFEVTFERVAADESWLPG